ncbi:MAG: hypothetical protein WC054_09385 [Candidatus Nanopelagicales bacterium]
MRTLNTTKKHRLVGLVAAVGVAVVTISGCSTNAEGDAAASISASDSPGDRSAQGADVLGEQVTLTNNLKTDVVVRVSQVENFDWRGQLRPDHAYPQGFQGATVKAGQTLSVQLTPNYTARGNPFRLNLSNNAGEFASVRLQSKSQAVKADNGLTFIGFGVEGKSGCGGSSPDFTYTGPSGTQNTGALVSTISSCSSNNYGDTAIVLTPK